MRRSSLSFFVAVGLALLTGAKTRMTQVNPATRACSVQISKITISSGLSVYGNSMHSRIRIAVGSCLRWFVQIKRSEPTSAHHRPSLLHVRRLWIFDLLDSMIAIWLADILVSHGGRTDIYQALVAARFLFIGYTFALFEISKLAILISQCSTSSSQSRQGFGTSEACCKDLPAGS